MSTRAGVCSTGDRRAGCAHCGRPWLRRGRPKNCRGHRPGTGAGVHRACIDSRWPPGRSTLAAFGVCSDSPSSWRPARTCARFQPLRHLARAGVEFPGSDRQPAPRHVRKMMPSSLCPGSGRLRPCTGPTPWRRVDPPPVIVPPFRHLWIAQQSYGVPPSAPVGPALVQISGDTLCCVGDPVVSPQHNVTAV